MQRIGRYLHLIIRNKYKVTKRRMKKISRLVIISAAAIMAFCAASCQTDDTIRYNNATMGNVVDGSFISDQGNIFNVVEQTCQGKLDTMKRAYVLCDILKSTEGSSNAYDIRLNYMSQVLTKDIIPSTELKDSLANDPLLLQDIWVSGGYVNLFINLPIDPKNSKQHRIECVFDQEESKDGEYVFCLRHDADGELLQDNGNNSNMVLAGAFASFPVSSLIKEDSAKITLKWKSYIVLEDGAVSFKTMDASVSRPYSKGTFEQVPSKTPASKSAEIR